MIVRAKEFPNQDAWTKYKEQHPNADKSNHTVKKTEDDKKEVEVDDEDGLEELALDIEPPEDDIMDFLKNDESVVSEVLQAIKDNKKPSLTDVAEAFSLTEKALKGEATSEEIEKIKKVNKYLREVLGEEDEEDNKKPTTSTLNLAQSYGIKKKHVDAVKNILKEVVDAENSNEEEYKSTQSKQQKKYEEEKKDVIDGLEEHELYEEDLEDLRAFMSRMRKEHEGKKEPDFQKLWQSEVGVEIPKKLFEKAVGLPPNPPKNIKKKPKLDDDEVLDKIKKSLDEEGKNALDEMEDEDVQSMISDLKKSMSKKASFMRRAFRLSYASRSTTDLFF